MGRYLLAGLAAAVVMGWFVAGPGIIRSRVAALVDESNHCAITTDCAAYDADYEFFPCPLYISRKEGAKVQAAVDLFKKLYPAAGKRTADCPSGVAVCREGRCGPWK